MLLLVQIAGTFCVMPSLSSNESQYVSGLGCTRLDERISICDSPTWQKDGCCRSLQCALWQVAIERSLVVVLGPYGDQIQPRLSCCASQAVHRVSQRQFVLSGFGWKLLLRALAER